MKQQMKTDLNLAFVRHGQVPSQALLDEIQSLVESYANHVLESFAQTLVNVAKSNAGKPIVEIIDQALLVHKLTHE